MRGYANRVLSQTLKNSGVSSIIHSISPRMPARKSVSPKPDKSKSLESWIWDAACSIRGAKDAPKYKDYILPLIFTKRLCDVFDDELNRIAKEVGSRKKAFQLVKADRKLVRFYLPLVPDDPEQPVWSVIRKLSDKIGEGVTSHLRDIARENPLLQGIIDRVDFNATTHGQRDLADDRLSNLIEAISTKRLGLDDVEADIIGKSYEYLIRKFAEGGGQSAGEFYTPGEVGEIMARVLEPEPAKLVGLISEVISAIPFRHASLNAKDILGHVYEYFLGQSSRARWTKQSFARRGPRQRHQFALAEGKKGGQYYTPKSIVSVIVAMLEPYSGKVYDPTMSSSGFFVQSESFIEAHGGKRRFNFENPVIFSLT